MTNISSIEIEPREKGYSTVTPIWTGVDRPDVGGWIVKNSLVGRLEQAIRSGKALVSAQIKTDVNGQTYWAASWRVSGKYMAADLRRLGF